MHWWRSGYGDGFGKNVAVTPIALRPSIKNIYTRLEFLKNFKEEYEGKIRTEKIVSDFQKIRFTISGKFTDMPKGHNRYVLTLYKNQVKLESIIPNHAFLEKEDSKYNDYLLSKPMYPNNIHLDEKKELSYVCMDNDKFVGGFHGYVQMDHFYLNFLYVDKQYRGKQISKKLIQIMEEEARNYNMTNIFLFTTSFQAPVFYEKQGYFKQFTIKDEPKGYFVYMYKKILS